MRHYDLLQLQALDLSPKNQQRARQLLKMRGRSWVVLRLVCQGTHALVPLATSGRYNGLLRHFAPGHQNTSGTGFSFNLERLRELLQGSRASLSHPNHVQVLVTYHHPGTLGAAMACLDCHHQAQVQAELLPSPMAGEVTQPQFRIRGCGCEAPWPSGALWQVCGESPFVACHLGTLAFAIG